jgi:hypothetical protein
MNRFSRIPTALFELGQIVTTPGVSHACTAEYLKDCLIGHATGDWGCVSAADAAQNTRAISFRHRILSAYPIDPKNPRPECGNSLWIVTEADRSMTTLRLPSEY